MGDTPPARFKIPPKGRIAIDIVYHKEEEKSPGFGTKAGKIYRVFRRISHKPAPVLQGRYELPLFSGLRPWAQKQRGDFRPLSAKNAKFFVFLQLVGLYFQKVSAIIGARHKKKCKQERDGRNTPPPVYGESHSPYTTTHAAHCTTYYTDSRPEKQGAESEVLLYLLGRRGCMDLFSVPGAFLLPCDKKRGGARVSFLTFPSTFSGLGSLISGPLASAPSDAGTKARQEE